MSKHYPILPKLGIKNRHLSPEKVYLLVENSYFDDDQRWITDGTTIIALSDYFSWCSNGKLKIFRVSSSLTVLKKYKRAHDFKQLQKEENKNKMTKKDYIKMRG